MDQAWYKDVDDNMKKIEKAMGLKDGSGGMGKAQECAMLYVLTKHSSYFGQNFTKEDVVMMEQNIRDDTNLFDGFHGPVSHIRAIREASELAKAHLEACLREKDEAIHNLTEQNKQWRENYDGAIAVLQDRIATLESGKYSIEEEWERAVARAEKAEIANLTMAKEIVRRKLVGKEELTDEERALVIQSL